MPDTLNISNRQTKRRRRRSPMRCVLEVISDGIGTHTRNSPDSGRNPSRPVHDNYTRLCRSLVHAVLGIREYDPSEGTYPLFGLQFLRRWTWHSWWRRDDLGQMVRTMLGFTKRDCCGAKYSTTGYSAVRGLYWRRRRVEFKSGCHRN